MKGLWFSFGLLALFLGAIGVVLPILPTTPFVILAAFAFGKSSPRLHTWLLNSRLFGPMIADWNAHGAIATRVKILACTMMGAVLLLSLLKGVPNTVLIVQIIGIAIGASYVISRPSGPKETRENQNS